MGAYVGQMRESGEELTNRGYICTGFDFKGYGQSEGIRGYFTSFDEWMDDVIRYMNVTIPIFPGGIPKYFLGYSLGGCLAIYISILNPGIVDGIITYAPAIAKPVFNHNIYTFRRIIGPN